MFIVKQEQILLPFKSYFVTVYENYNSNSTFNLYFLKRVIFDVICLLILKNELQILEPLVAANKRTCYDPIIFLIHFCPSLF